MAISPARTAAFDILLRVEEENSYASELLHSDRLASLSNPDHGLATELVMGVLRWRSWLDQQIRPHSSKALSKLDPEVMTALRVGTYQLLFLERVPQRAAVHESVELVKRARKTSAAPFVNAVLRKIADGGNRFDGVGNPRGAAELATAAAHPEWLVKRWVNHYGLEAARAICQYDQQKPAMAVRFRRPEVKAELEAAGIRFSSGKLLASAYRVEGGDVSQGRAFRENEVSIQDEASQLVALLVGRGERILDCCAAPGGKTLAIAGLNPSARVVAVELHEHRARALRERLAKASVEVVTGDITSLPGEVDFDRVLADVPCSGTGTLARNPEIKWRLQAADLAKLMELQLGILRSAMKRVAKGGRLVYATCSLEPEENEQLIQQVLQEDSSFQLRDCRLELERLGEEGSLAWKDADSLLSGPYLRTIPGVHPCDGFFAAVMEKL